MAKRKRKNKEQERIQTLKERRLAAQQRERDNRFLLFGGIAGGSAVLLVLVGLFLNFIYLPSTTVVSVNGQKITTEDFRKRYRFERQAALDQLNYYQMLQRQFGGQLNVQAEIRRMQSFLSDAFSMGVRVKTLMIEDILIAQAAAQEGVTVSEAEVESYLAEEIAQRYEKFTPAQATATITARKEQEEADATATAIAELTPAPEADPDATPTALPLPTATPEPIDVLSDTDITQGREGLATDLRDAYNMTVTEYEEILRARFRRDMMVEHIGSPEAAATEQQVWARHILLTFNDQPLPDNPETTTADQAAADGPVVLGGRSEEETLALAHVLRDRLAVGESFAYLVDLYSDDPSKVSNRGDLGWFGPGRMAPEFEAAAFALEPNSYSEPIKTDFGYHIIEVLASNPEAPRDSADIQADVRAAFEAWLDQLKTEATIEEKGSLNSQLPPGAEREVQEFLTGQ